MSECEHGFSHKDSCPVCYEPDVVDEVKSLSWDMLSKKNTQIDRLTADKEKLRKRNVKLRKALETAVQMIHPADMKLYANAAEQIRQALADTE